MTITVTLDSLKEAGPKQTKLVEDACSVLAETLNTQEFAEYAIAAQYRETRRREPNGNRRSLSPAEVLGVVQAGSRPDSGNSQISIENVLVKKRRGIVGSTNLGRPPIWTAYWFINKCIEDGAVAAYAGHLLHEWLHVAGFYHYPGNSARNDVSYLLGRYVAQNGQSSLEAQGLSFVEVYDLLPCGLANYESEEANDDMGEQ